MTSSTTSNVNINNNQPLQPFWSKRRLDAKEILIEDAIKLFLSDKSIRKSRNDNTIKTYTESLNRFSQFTTGFNLIKLNDIDQDMLAGYVDALNSPFDENNHRPHEINKREWLEKKFWSEPWSDNYIADLCRPIGTLINYYQKRGKLPKFYYELPEEDDDAPLYTPDDEDFNKILGACQSERDFLIIALIGDTGLRRHEVVSANWEDLQSDRIRVIGKGNKLRSIPVSKDLIDQLNSYRLSLPAFARGAKSPIFPSSRGGRLTISGLQSIIERIRTAAGIQFSAHALRRYAMRTWLRAGKTLDEIREAAGHEDMKTTHHYLGRFEPLVSEHSLETTGFKYLIQNKKIQNITWQAVIGSRKGKKK